MTQYIGLVIQTFADTVTEELFLTGRSRRIPATITRHALRRLEYLHLATCLADLRVPPSNRLHALGGERRGQYAIAVNEQYRICFRFHNGDAFDVEFTDYH